MWAVSTEGWPLQGLDAEGPTSHLRKPPVPMPQPSRPRRVPGGQWPRSLQQLPRPFMSVQYKPQLQRAWSRAGRTSRDPSPPPSKDPRGVCICGTRAAEGRWLSQETVCVVAPSVTSPRTLNTVQPPPHPHPVLYLRLARRVPNPPISSDNVDRRRASSQLYATATSPPHRAGQGLPLSLRGRPLQAQQPSDRLQGRGSEVGRGDRGIYLNLHSRSCDTVREKSLSLALRKKRTTKNNACALFKRCGLSLFSSQQIKDNNTATSPELPPFPSPCTPHPPHTHKKNPDG